MVNDCRTGRHCVFENYVHLVFVKKYRKKVFTQNMLDRLKELFAETCLQMECELQEFNGEIDHVHLLVSLHPKHSISNLVGKLKGKSSYFLRREFTKELEKNFGGITCGHTHIALFLAAEHHWKLLKNMWRIRENLEK